MIQRRIQRFEVVDEIGAGGMGQVFRARDPELERDVAIKMLAVAKPPSELSERDTLDLRSDRATPRDELLREARIMARLSHPNVLPVYEVGLCDDSMFLVMEHIDGADLAAWLGAPRSTGEILGVFRQVARGLEAAHACGIVHRDIKPGNILIGRDGRVRVADFGLSRLTTRPTTAMVYVDDGRGTPRYMAPELWRGSAATVGSDVYALCLTMVEALLGERSNSQELDRRLRERGVAPVLRGHLARGLAEDPSMRPELGALLTALEGQRSRRRAWLVAGLSAAAVAAVIAGGVRANSDAESRVAASAVISCDPDPSTLVGRWDDKRQTELASMLVETAHPELRWVAERIAADVAAYKQEVDRGYGAACEAVRAGQITVEQYRMRASCLRRRGFEIAETVELMIETKPTLIDARDRYLGPAKPRDCMDITAPPIAKDLAAVESLWRRYIRAGVHLSKYLDELTAISAAAAVIGEIELVVRANRWRGLAYRNMNDLARADLELQQAYRQAQELHANSIMIATLLDRAHVAQLRSDNKTELSLAELAKQSAEQVDVSVTLRARSYQVLGYAYQERGDEEAALAQLRSALELLRAERAGMSLLEMRIRTALMVALTQQAVQEPAAIELGKENVDLARMYAGPQNEVHSHALILLGQAYAATGDYARAISHVRQGIESIRPRLTPLWQSNFSQYVVLLVRALHGAGKLDEAHREIAALHKLHWYRRNDWISEGLFAMIAFERGNHREGLAGARHALDEAISEYTKQNNRTTELRGWVIKLLLEMGKLDDAAYQFAALETAYAEHSARHQLRLHRVRATLGAELAIARGKPGDAKAMARAALDAAQNLRATDRDRADFLASLGRALVAERAWSQAQAPLTEALALLHTMQARPDDIAAVEVELASVEQGLGERAAALARTKRARAVLAEYPGKLRARAKADALLRGKL